MNIDGLRVGILVIAVGAWTAPLHAQVLGGSLGGGLGGTMGTAARGQVSGGFDSTLDPAGSAQHVRQTASQRVQAARERVESASQATVSRSASLGTNAALTAQSHAASTGAALAQGAQPPVSTVSEPAPANGAIASATGFDAGASAGVDAAVPVTTSGEAAQAASVRGFKSSASASRTGGASLGGSASHGSDATLALDRAVPGAEASANESAADDRGSSNRDREADRNRE
jgi:hypothetical protein